MILQGNSLELMRKMDAGSVDVVITDPPYAGFGFKNQVAAYWETFAPYYAEMERLCTADQRIALSQPPARHALFEAKLPPHRILTIERAFADHRPQPAMFLLMNPHIDEVPSAEDWPEDIVPKTIHPNERDINKMAIVVKAMSKEGDTVLDPFCGSGAIGVACALLGRKHIGIELMADRAEDAKTRMEAAEERYQSLNK